MGKPIAEAAAKRATAPMPSKPTTTMARSLEQKNPTLNTALETVHASRLRNIIKDLCLISDSTAAYISKLLLTPEGPDVNGETTHKRSRSAVDAKPESSNGPKRIKMKMKIRYATCIQCDREFDVTLNSGRPCRYHPGSREADYGSDVWADHDENCHGHISDLEDEYPEGFQWTCCERPGDMGGCRRGPHRQEGGEMAGGRDESVSADEESDDGDSGSGSGSGC